MRILSLAFGLLMVAAGAVLSTGPALVAAVVALVAVLAGLASRGAATVAVVATAAALALSASSPVLAALAGLAAMVYLLLRYASAGAASAVLTVPTMLGALCFSAVGVVAATVPLSLPWVPLVAPLAVVGLYVVGVDRYVGNTGPLR